jgi:hypothetical protein
MLLAMQQPSTSAPSPTSSTFAGLLAALAAPEPTPGDSSSSTEWKSEASGDKSSPAGWRRSSSAWDDEGLADDVASLSYESALKAHTRYRPTDQSLLEAAEPEPIRVAAPAPASPRRSAADFKAKLDSGADPAPQVRRPPATHFERNLKSASITIRMSETECAQLHHRAAEAGLTISAYLRSCTFEAESLRAMVKDTLTQLRVATSETTPENPAPVQHLRFRERLHSLSGWLARLFTPWHGSPRVARA